MHSKEKDVSRHLLITLHLLPNVQWAILKLHLTRCLQLLLILSVWTEVTRRSTRPFYTDTFKNCQIPRLYEYDWDSYNTILKKSILKRLQWKLSHEWSNRWLLLFIISIFCFKLSYFILHVYYRLCGFPNMSNTHYTDVEHTFFSYLHNILRKAYVRWCF